MVEYCSLEIVFDTFDFNFFKKGILAKNVGDQMLIFIKQALHAVSSKSHQVHAVSEHALKLKDDINEAIPALPTSPREN